MIIKKIKNNFILLTSILMIGCLSGCTDSEDQYHGDISVISPDEWLDEPGSRQFSPGEELKVIFVHQSYEGKAKYIDVSLQQGTQLYGGDPQITKTYKFETFYPKNERDTFEFVYQIPIELPQIPSNEEVNIAFKIVGSGSSRGGRTFRLDSFN